MTEEQITRLYGPRCAEHCDDCCVCEVWAMHDHIEKLEADNARLRGANQAAAECVAAMMKECARYRDEIRAALQETSHDA